MPAAPTCARARGLSIESAVFTGLIADLGSVTTVRRNGAGAQLRISTRLAADLRTGDSVAVNGVCLTATDIGDGAFAAEAVSETLQRSTLGDLRAGASVNLELPLRASDRLGGHVVQGHVDSTGTVGEIRAEPLAHVLAIDADGGLERYLVEKGSIAVDGVSLTVSALDGSRFEVALIPETLQRTTLGALEVGDRVNLEADVLAKHVERLLEARA